MKHKKSLTKNKKANKDPDSDPDPENNNFKDNKDNLVNENNKNNKNKKEFSKDLDLVEDTYKFLEDINNKLSEIKKIKTNRINGIIDLEISSEIMKNKNNKIDGFIKENKNEDEEICIIYEDKFDMKNLCYEKNYLKLEKFNPNFDCLICFKKIITKFDIKCNHKFCIKCGNKWKLIKKTCPVCLLPF
jgi:hypothetical protein